MVPLLHDWQHAFVLADLGPDAGHRRDDADRDQRGDQPYSIAVTPLWSFHSLRNARIVLRFGLDPVAPGNDVARSDGRKWNNAKPAARARAEIKPVRFLAERQTELR